MATPAGWYDDPMNPEKYQRYWNGEKWTEHLDEKDPEPARESMFAAMPPPAAQEPVTPPPPQRPTPTAPTPQPLAPSTPGSRPWWKKKRVLIPAGAFAGLAVIAGVTADPEEDAEEVAVEVAQEEAADEEAEGPTVEAEEEAPETTTTTEAPTTTTTAAPTTTTTAPPVEPLVLTGSGDSVIAVDKDDSHYILDVVHTGSGGNFSVISYDAAGERIDLLVNEIGPYEGRLLVDVADDESTALLEITASGDWSFTYQPFDVLSFAAAPSISGTGSNVFLWQEPDLTVGDFQVSGGGNFAVWALGDRRDLIVNEIAPYSGQALIPKGTVLLEVSADGEWSIAISAP